MNEIRRKIVTAVPLVPLVGLSACGGGGEVAGETSQANAGGRAQAMAAGTVNGLGLKVTQPSIWYKLDSVFTAYSDLKVIVPDATPVCQACLNGTTLYVTLTEEIRGYRRSVILKLAAPALNTSYTVSALAAGDAMVVVNDGTSGSHYEYILNSGTIKLTGYDTSTNKATMSFTNVQGSPTLTTIAPGNAATRALRLDGVLATAFRQETAAWMV